MILRFEACGNADKITGVPPHPDYCLPAAARTGAIFKGH
jgi:hypothetical protein